MVLCAFLNTGQFPHPFKSPDLCMDHIASALKGGPRRSEERVWAEPLVCGLDKAGLTPLYKSQGMAPTLLAPNRGAPGSSRVLLHVILYFLSC